MKRFWLFLVLLVYLIIPLKAGADIQLDFKGFIADEANILPKDVKNDLNMTLWDLQKKSGADIAVVIIDSLNGKSVEEVAIDIGRTYKVGAKEKNNGIVFLTALNDRKMRIELGSGLKNRISTASLNNIRDYDILPYYKKNDYVDGIARGTYKLAELVASVENVELKTQGYCPAKLASDSSRKKEHVPWWVYVLAIIMSIFSPRRRRFNYGSFGGFGGGGGFGGCGSSGSW
jgi:uncharacterized protein